MLVSNEFCNDFCIKMLLSLICLSLDINSHKKEIINPDMFVETFINLHLHHFLIQCMLHWLLSICSKGAQMQLFNMTASENAHMALHHRPTFKACGAFTHSIPLRSLPIYFSTASWPSGLHPSSLFHWWDGETPCPKSKECSYMYMQNQPI